MRILHLTTFLQGGAGLVIASLAAAQRAAGHDVVVVTSATEVPGYGNYPGHLDTLRRAGVDVHLVDSLFTRDDTAALHVLTFLLAHPTASRADVVHAHAATPGRLGHLFARHAGPRPLLQTMHGWGVAKTTDQQRADVETLERADRVVVPAESSARLLEDLGVTAARIRVIAYGVGPLAERRQPVHRIESAMAEWRHTGGHVVCCPGTVGARKNQSVLVDALALLPASSRVLCVFVGDGDTTALQAYAEARGVVDRIRICGYHEDARHIVRAADHLVLPSLSEGQPLSILEAFCDRVPVIVSRIAELRELVEDGACGLLLDPRNAADVARVLSEASASSAAQRSQLAARGHAAWASRFSSARMHDRHVAVYEELRAASSSAR